jgi:phage-related protein
VSIRVVPDTTKFRPQAKRELERIAKTLTMKVRVTGLEADRSRLQQSLDRQVAKMTAPKVDVDGTVNVTKADLQKQKLRAQIQQQLNEFGDFRTNLKAQVADKEKFERELKKLVDRAERNEVDIPVAVTTAVANARLAYTSRTRIVELIVKVNRASAISAATTLAALSGARLSGQMLSDIGDFAKNLDKSLPSIVNWTTGITSLVGGVFAAISGVVGLGQGLVALAPGLLLVPGLIANAAGSLTVLVVALRNAGTELAPLKSSISELGDIINGTFWDRARQPIIDLVTNLMPQLRNSFRDISAGVGDFTAEMSRAFGEELANGRLESIFKGIADGWRILASGADGFAGAMVSLSQIAANYTPRLASWLVRQANTLDKWLTDISSDGRLAAWMEGAIDSAYALWDATTGIAGVFSGIWKAADQAGSGGLRGFADMMQEWDRVVNGAQFQKGLTAIFRGSYVAMDAFGDAVEAVGNLLADQSAAVERFIGSSGTFLGGLAEGIANALNSPKVAAGLDGFSSGLVSALEGIQPSLQPIADTFGGFLGLLGDLTANLLPTAASVLADLMPSIDGLISAIGPALPDLASAVTSISDRLGPAAADLVEALSPMVVDAFVGLAESIADLAPAVATLVDGLSEAVEGLNTWSDNNKGFFETLRLSLTPDGQKWNVELEQLVGDHLRGPNGFVMPQMDPAQAGDVKAYAAAILAVYREELEKGGPEAGEAFLDGLRDVDMPATLRDQLENAFGPDLDQQLIEKGRLGGGGFSRGLTMGFTETPMDFGTPTRVNLDHSFGTAGEWLKPKGKGLMEGLRLGSANEAPNTAGWFGGLGPTFSGAMNGASAWLTGRGGDTIRGFRSGADGEFPNVQGWFGGLGGRISIPNAGSILIGAGSAIMGGFLGSLRTAYVGVQTFIGGIAGWIRDNKGPESYDRRLLEPAGGWIMGGFERGLVDGFGRVQNRVRTMASSVREELGLGLASGIQSDLASGMEVARLAARAVPLAATGTDGSPTDSAAGGDVFQFYGVTTDTAASEIATAIETARRRRLARSGALAKAGVR